MFAIMIQVNERVNRCAVFTYVDAVEYLLEQVLDGAGVAEIEGELALYKRELAALPRRMGDSRE